jgi:hypothetical protein
MIGFDNQWAVLLRKQCEAVPLSLLGLYNLVLAVAIDVPVAKCMCIDAYQNGQGNFRKNAMDKCFYFIPKHKHPAVLAMIENSYYLGDEKTACNVLVQEANSNVKNSMDAWFDKMFQASDAIASSFDYLLRFFDVDAGRCLDFDGNPFATVLIPEPFDYFAGCAMTTLCENKCRTEISTFNDALLRYGQQGNSRRLDTVATSLFFNNLDEDALMPMKIVTMVELSNCDVVCGGTSSTDTCIAVAGISANETIIVKKYCVPRAVGYSVRSASSETWTVWYSANWTSSATDIQFADTIDGDVLVVLRDGRGQSNMGPDEQFVTIHPRSIQTNGAEWDRWYSTEPDRLQRLMFSQTSSNINGVDRSDKPLAVAAMFVFPKQLSAGNTYIAMSIIMDMGNAGVNTDHRITVCGSLNIASFTYSRGTNGKSLSVCELGNFFEKMRDNGYVPVVYQALSDSDVHVAMVPAAPEQSVSVLLFTMGQEKVHFDSSSPASRRDYPAASGGAGGSVFPTYQQFSEFSKNAMTGMRSLVGRSGVTQDGVAVLVKPRMAQNTNSYSTSNEVKFFMSGDPNMPTHWLTMVRILLSDTFTVTQSASETVEVSISVLQTCDRRSCLGCAARLQGLCYAAQQCSVVNCIGTVVNQIKPLCNVGLSLQSSTNELIALTLGAWTVFTESYSSILKISLIETENTLKVEWVDDVFFGFVCSAKDKGGQVAALLTSAIGAAVITRERTIDIDGDRNTLIDTRASARNTIILNGVNAFLYQVRSPLCVDFFFFA